MTVEFTPWPKTSRLFRDVVITEKIDGTNAGIHITEDEVVAQSRKRLITPESDNFGFAAWVAANADGLREVLGMGLHFGEWWGSGIQRNYGYTNGERFFSLFNTAKWADQTVEFGKVPGLGVVPVLFEGLFDQLILENVALDLEQFGSEVAAPDWNGQPEGVCIFHTQSRQVYKYTFDGDGHKGDAK